MIARECAAVGDDPIFLLNQGLARAGPGGDRSTLEALARCPALPAEPRVLDLGCGPGPQTLALAGALGGQILAVDFHRPFLDQLERSARSKGLERHIQTLCADMGTLELEPGGFDLVWSEGAIYLLGFEAGLRAWKGFLARDGVMAVSECCWLTDDPPREVEAFWRAAYPAMGSIAQNRARAAAAGLRVFDSFALPSADWWDGYYGPLQARLDALRPGADGSLLAAIEETESEIEFYRRYGHTYGYVFFLMAPDQ